MAFSNEVVFLSHQLQLALLMAVFAALTTHELDKGCRNVASLTVLAGCLVLIDPLRHVVYDAQFNPKQCGPPGHLMSKDGFYALAKVARGGQVVGNVLLFALAFKNHIFQLGDHGSGSAIARSAQQAGSHGSILSGENIEKRT
eukprot:TRINITY_DN8697_c0_g2_i1.p1 TRINITY_DN8697_c0_g2~~TRINITY_DN8697_c0_g2_i1.p1  ORF type:complete len:143 (-),score=33.42 TRINITY_DN8697_c0_g2_i1:39-467(-)